MGSVVMIKTVLSFIFILFFYFILLIYLFFFFYTVTSVIFDPPLAPQS